MTTITYFLLQYFNSIKVIFSFNLCYSIARALFSWVRWQRFGEFEPSAFSIFFDCKQIWATSLRLCLLVHLTILRQSLARRRTNGHWLVDDHGSWRKIVLDASVLEVLRGHHWRYDKICFCFLMATTVPIRALKLSNVCRDWTLLKWVTIPGANEMG